MMIESKIDITPFGPIMKILIAGGAGFVGSQSTDQMLAEGMA